MQSFVWFVSACRIWTGAVLWALENEPEQIMVCCTGWKIERTYLAAGSPKKKTRLQVSLCNNSQKAHPRTHTHTHRLPHNTHVSICTPQTPSTHIAITTIPLNKRFLFPLWPPSPSPCQIFRAHSASRQSHHCLFRETDNWSRALLSAREKQKLPKPEKKPLCQR